MAVTTTPRAIIEGAHGKSLKNKAGQIATDATELLNVVIRATRGLWAFAARINPTFFSTSTSVAFASPGWARPVNAESVFRIENVTPVEVVVVDIDDRKAETGKPAVYRLGQIYRGAGNALDPISGNLTFFFSKRPTDPANLDALLDPLWEGAEQFNELAILEVAIYLALKDGRAEEIPGLTADRDNWAQLFAAFLEHETVNVVRRYGHVRRFNTDSLVPVMSLLAGPAQVAA